MQELLFPPYSLLMLCRVKLAPWTAKGQHRGSTGLDETSTGVAQQGHHKGATGLDQAGTGGPQQG